MSKEDRLQIINVAVCSYVLNLETGEQRAKMIEVEAALAKEYKLKIFAELLVGLTVSDRLKVFIGDAGSFIVKKKNIA